ncbi:MAG: aminopeptidase P family protein [Thaumarchaeota archaeon]|nr:aminopeptidase P family protein [Nitrososphaerota archaeon]
MPVNRALVDYSGRMLRLRRVLDERGLAGAVVTSYANLRYLTGSSEEMWERFAGLFLPSSGESSLVVPELSGGSAAAFGELASLLTYSDQEGPGECVGKVLGAFGRRGRIGVEWSFRFRDLELLREKGRYSLQNISVMLSGMRAVKDDEELGLIKKACSVTEEGLEDTVSQIRVGMMEIEVAARLRESIVDHGGENVPFCLVQSGPNAAVPHTQPGRRKIARGDVVVIDVGCTVAGYNSDVTRVVSIGRLGSEQKRAMEAVLEAQDKAISKVRPGVRAKDVDKAARRVVTGAGYGENFVHRTGHGLGLEVHEDPYINGGNAEALREGMVFTVEPGVYLKGRFGVRVEDDVRVSSRGCEVLTKGRKVFV